MRRGAAHLACSNKAPAGNQQAISKLAVERPSQRAAPHYVLVCGRRKKVSAMVALLRQRAHGCRTKHQRRRAHRPPAIS